MEKENREFKDSVFVDLFYRDETAKYRTKQVKIPTPEFYTFYNGEKDCPLEQELCLSDAFLVPPGKATLELKVTVININSGKGHELLEKCRVLKEYSLFIGEVRRHWKEDGNLKIAINSCVQKGILADYLKRKGSEVWNMLTAEYSYEKDIQVKQWEAKEEGWAEGRAEGRTEERILLGKIFRFVRKNPDVLDSQAAAELGCTPQEVSDVRKLFDI